VYVETALIAYATDRIFGEFKQIRHPVVLMGDYIAWFEKKFYADSIVRGMILTLSLLCITFGISVAIQSLLTPHSSLLTLLVEGVIASTAIASKMLYDSVKEIIVRPQQIRYLVSRDTEHLSDSDINKAAIETYAENLSDGVIAPLFYLILFGLWGAFVYKAINTLDSMVGYRNERYEKFGKFAAKLDDVANYIPARMTSVLIVLLMKGRHLGLPLRKIWIQGSKHESLNAGYPIAAMGWKLGVKLGGPTSYFGKVVPKPYFGTGREEITDLDIEAALALQPRLDIVLLTLFGIGAIVC